MKEKSYLKTVAACFTAYICQAVAVNFVPLLFVTFNKTYGIPLEEITVLVILNFVSQLITDMVASKYVSKIGYRPCLIACHVFCCTGFLAMAVLPDLINPFMGLLIATVIYSVGAGLIEVLLNPVIESCPIKNKARILSVMHSFYCWGVVGAVLISTAFFAIFGLENWKILTCIWALIPFCNAILFAFVPLYPIAEETEDGANYKKLFSQPVFIIIMIVMLCAGAAELTVGQWASTFVEQGLNIPKSYGDLVGVCGFAVCMGISRMIYAKYSEHVSIYRVLIYSALLCVVSYLLIGIAASPILALAGCLLCGLSVGMFWPGVILIASRKVKAGGTTMYALCALGGDVGCTAGPALAGFMTGVLGDSLRLGILCSIIFPIILLGGVIMLSKNK